MGFPKYWLTTKGLPRYIPPHPSRAQSLVVAAAASARHETIDILRTHRPLAMISR